MIETPISSVWLTPSAMRKLSDTLHHNPRWAIVQHKGRTQPYTVYDGNGYVVRFYERAEDAAAYLEHAANRKRPL